MDDRKKNLELFAKQLSEGLPFAEDFLNATPDVEYNALNARDLSEDALAHQVLKNTGIPIPHDGASIGKKEDFLNRIIAERFPEIKDPNVRIGDSDQYLKGNIQVRNRPDIIETVGKTLHEGGHNYDDKVLGYKGQNLDLSTLRDAKKSGMNLKQMDPAQVYELYAKNHHANIPNLREGSFGLGALKSILKNGEFKAVGSPLGALWAAVQEAYKPDPLPSANPTAQAKIAQAYEAMKHNPNDPAVKKAYDALSNEVAQQYEDLVTNKGLKTTKIGENFPNPYKTSTDLITDVKTNNHMAYYPTEIGYGVGDASTAVQDHPLLKPTKFLDPDGKPMPANDLFRVVHDYYGHVDGENKFGATGEERAFQQHKKMLSPEAQKALASETRGQNSWVNYGPVGEENRKNPANTIYAEQKAGLLPNELMDDLEKIENPKLYRMNALSKLAAKAMAPIGVLSAVAPVAADLKEGKPNTALARVVSSAAPFGTEEVTDKLMQDANLADVAPELTNDSYVQTLKNIGTRRVKEGRSPVVETISGQKVDANATENSDYENRVKALQRFASQG
jgi:hypothetical protein